MAEARGRCLLLAQGFTAEEYWWRKTKWNVLKPTLPEWLRLLVAEWQETALDFDRRERAQWLARWQNKHAKLCTWVEANIDETFAFYRLPREHHKHLKSTNMLERLNQEIKRRTLLVRIFPDEPSCLRLVRALAVEIHEEWVDENRYLDMELLRQHLKRLASLQPKAA